MCHCLMDRKKLINALLLVALVIFIGQNVHGQAEEDESRCIKAANCDECMRIGSECHWCEDGNFTLGGRLNRPRCGEINVLTKDKCQNIRYLNDTKHEITDNTPYDSVIQVRPQKLTVALRAGNAKKFKVNIKPAEDFPVDIYFLNDLSFSMKEDLANLRKLSNKIAEEIGTITKNYRLGFGAFIDKPTQPFIFYPQDFPEFPCTRKETELGSCQFKRPIFGYSHIFDFSANTTAFQEAVETIDVSADIDDAEGCFDGLMQAVVCESVLKWKARGRARRLIIMATDAEPKLAGDGKLANILKPNDGKCYLKERLVSGKSEMYYYKTLDMDYPSISQLRRVMKEAGVAPILAVSKPFIDQYKKIAEHWNELGSAAEVLTEDSTNIVEVVRDNYQRIATTVALTDEAPPYLEISYKVDRTTCTTPARVVSDSVCADVKLNKEIVFDVEIKLKECPNPLPEDPSVKIRIAGFGEVTVDIEYLCECNCEKEPLSSKCNKKGDYKCGICDCTEGFFGSLCQCDASKVSRNDTSKCIDPKNSKQICSGDGQCICGVCECTPKQSPRVISGEFCQCKNYGCPKYLGSECGSAETEKRGVCECGKCRCVPPYKGINCGEIECVTQQKLTCRKGGIECSGHGKCLDNCKDCKCDAGYAGENCEKCITQDCKCATIDPSCLKCHVTNSTCAEELNCDQHVFILSDNSTFPISCNVKYNDDLCTATYNFTREYLHNTSMVWEYVTGCTVAVSQGDDTGTLAIILGIIAGILLLGLLLLLLWKLLVTLHDKKEYAKFERAQNDSSWEKDGNPIYREPNQQFVNPAYAGES